jgi:hypothetical protein
VRYKIQIEKKAKMGSRLTHHQKVKPARKTCIITSKITTNLTFFKESKKIEQQLKEDALNMAKQVKLLLLGNHSIFFSE